MPSSSAPEPRPDAEPEALPAASRTGEFTAFLRDNKKWWLIPLVASLLLFAGVVLLSRNTASPFVYTLF